MVAAVFHRLFTLRQRRPATKIRKRRRTFPGIEQLADRTLLSVGGEFSVNFVAGNPTLYAALPVENTHTPVGDTDNDPIANADYSDACGTSIYVTSLAPSQIARNQILPYFVEIARDSTGTGSASVEINAFWSTTTTGGSDFGYDRTIDDTLVSTLDHPGILAAFIDTADPGTSPGTAAATVFSIETSIANDGGSKERIEGKIVVDGLEPGETVILEIWTALEEKPIPADVSGNIQAGLISVKAFEEGSSNGSKVTSGKQTVPLLKIQNLLKAPSAVDDVGSVGEDGPAVVIDSLNNDSLGTGSGPLVIDPISFTQPAKGTVTLVNNKFEFDPNGLFNSLALNDSEDVVFFYQAVDDSNGAHSNIAKVTVTVNGVNDGPVGENAIADKENWDGQTITPVDVTGFFSDVDGDTLTYSASGLPGSLTINTTTGVISGTFDFRASHVEDDNDGTQDYIVTVTASDGLASADQVFTWTVVNVDPVAQDDSFTTNEDTSVSGNVLTNTTPNAADSDILPDGDDLTVASNTDPKYGTLTSGVSLNGEFTYAPDADFHGEDTFTYEISDGNGGTDTGTVTITINPVNDSDPVADPESFTVDEGGTATQTDLDLGADLLDGDPDLPNDTLTVDVTPASGPSHGTLTLFADGTFSYTHDGTENFSDSFTYTLRDAAGHTDTGEVTITINPVNEPPENLSYNDGDIDEDMSFDLYVSFTDSDVGDSHTAVIDWKDGTPIESCIVIGGCC